MLWACLVPLPDGLRVQFHFDDWLKLGFHEGQRVPVRLSGEPDRWLLVVRPVEKPPVVWVELLSRVPAAA